MNMNEAIAEARRLSNGSPVKWYVIRRGEEYRLKIINGSLNGHRVDVDYSESQIVWTPRLP